jgi:hypothetical protein
LFKICLTLLLALPSALYSQTTQSSSQVTSYDNPADTNSGGGGQQTTDASGRLWSRGMFAPRRHDAPVASFTASYVYMYSPGLAGANRSLMGWAAVPEVNFTKYLGLQADFEGLYVRSIYPGQNRLVLAAGPRINFAPRSKFTPFVYMEGGEVRLTSQANRLSDWNPVAKGGFGFDHKMAHGFGFQLIPGEYQGQYLDNGTWSHSFVSRVGITFNGFR